MKDVMLAIVTLAGIMFYVEIRLSHIYVQGQEYAVVGVLKLNDHGNTIYTPVYKEKK